MRMGITALFALALAAAAVAGCGSSEEGDSGGGAKSGGAIQIGTVGPDSYDPALFQTIQAVQPLQAVYTPLTTYRHEEGKAGGEIIAGLATDVPEVTDRGKTYTMTLRKGLHYSDGAPVKASHFTHAIKRVLTLKGPYSSFFTGIEGADAYQRKGGKSAALRGIETDDRTGKIVINLKQPDGKFPYALSEPYAAPINPKKSPFKSQTENPPPGVGPYSLKVIDPSRKFVLTRNRDFRVGDLPRGNIDKITGVVTDSVPRMTQDVIKGQLDFMTEDPTGDLLPRVRRQYGDRLREDANPPNTYYFFLNVQLPPFDELDARKAVNYAIDSRALVRLFGGRLEPGCTFLPPDLVGYKKFDCPYGDPNGPGDLKKARELVERSGTKGQTVTVWTNNKDPRPAIAGYYADVLSQIGYETKIKTVDQQVYFDRIGTKSSKAQTGFTNWLQDFPHPADFFQPLLSSESLQSTPTNNQGFVEDPALDKEISRLTKALDLEQVASDWGDLDEQVIKDKAYVVPYGYEKKASFFSERMNFSSCAGVHPVWQNDWTQFCLK